MTASAIQHVIIVGASRGIGLGLAQEYARRGWRVIATVRDASRAVRLKALAASAPDRVTLETMDITRCDQVAAFARRIAGGSFDVVIVNAGILGPAEQHVDKVSPADVATIFYTNAVAPVCVAERIIEFVKPKTGVVAFMSSRTGSVAAESNGTKPLYRASKAALNSLTRSFVAGLKDGSITVLSMHPGWVRTELGGPDATLDVPTSATGIADVIAAHAGTRIHAFVDYAGNQLVW